jgi:uncharacterized DUF497 family protein
MEITFDPAKRDLTLKHRGLDFTRAAEVFAGRTATVVDDRFEYGETVSSAWVFSTSDWWFWSGRNVAKIATSFQ